MKNARILLVLLALLVSACSYRILVVPQCGPKDRMPAPMKSPDSSENNAPEDWRRKLDAAMTETERPYRYAAPRTHRDSLLHELEKESRKTAAEAWHKTKYLCPLWYGK